MSIGVFKTLNLFILFIEQVARTHKRGENIAGAFEAIGATVTDGSMEAKYGRGHAGTLFSATKNEDLILNPDGS